MKPDDANQPGRTVSRTLHIRLFGAFYLRYDDEPVVAVDTPRLQSLLTFLLLHRDRPQPRYHVAFRLWPDSTDTQAQTNLRKQLYYLRRRLPDADRFLYVDDKSVQWRPTAPFRLDVAEFEAALGEADRAAHTGDRQALRAALDRAIMLYQGDLVPSCYDEWIVPERERLYQLFLSVLERQVRYLEQQGAYAAAIRYGERLLQYEPLREATYRRLMRLHAACGDRAGALSVYEAGAAAIRRELGVEPAPATRELHRRLLQLDDVPRRLRALPVPATPFVGRDEELAEIMRRVRAPASRLVTLVGPGGVGKTRLAIEAARRAAEARITFLHGVYFVPLASVTSSAELVTAIAAAVGFSFHGTDPPQEQLLNYLRGKELLLILDNFEHLLDDVTLIVEILATAPDVTFLVTSRERLHLQQEWLGDVVGLPFPPSDDVTPDEAAGFAAVRLFVQNAKRVRSTFSLSPERAPAVARICRLVEGFPLGIELAAALLRTHSCRDVARELEHGLDLPETSRRDVPARHHSLRAAFDHSWTLLSEEERNVLERLSVFRGGFRIEAAEQVADASRGILRALHEKSLLRREASDRYNMHELVRQYAAERLAADGGKRDRTRTHHACYYADYLRQREQALRNEDQEQALTEIGAAIDNVRAAWQWTIEHAMLDEVRTATESLFTFYDTRGWFHEGEAVFRRTHEHLEPSDAPGLRARVRARQAVFLYRLARYDDATDLLRESLAVFRRRSAREEVAFCLHWLGAAANRQGDYETATRLSTESLAIRRDIGDGWGTAATLNQLGNVARILGNYADARRHLDESLTLCRQTRDRRTTASVLNNLGIVAGALGEYDDAEAFLEQSLAIRRDLEDRWGVAKTLNNLGQVARLRGDQTTARRHYRESLAIRREIGNPFGVALVLNNLGLVAHDVGEYGEARRLVEQSLAIRRDIADPWGTASSLNNLGTITAALGEHGDAQRYFEEALKIAVDIDNVPMVLDVIAGIGALYTTAGQTQRAVELLSLVLHHPATEAATRERVARYRSEVQVSTAPESAQSADRSLEDVVTALLAHYG